MPITLPTKPSRSHHPSPGKRRLVALVAFAVVACVGSDGLAQEQLVLKAVDRETGKPIAVRMHLKNAHGKPPRVTGVAEWKDHFVFDGDVTLQLPRGNYTFEMECGPEFLRRTGYFTIQPFANDEKTVDMKRFVNLAKEGWYAGDMNVARKLDDVPLLMKAEDLYVAQAIAWGQRINAWKGKTLPENPIVEFDGRFYNAMAGRDRRAGGRLLLLGRSRPFDLPPGKGEYPSTMDVIASLEADADSLHADALHIDVEKAYWQDLPLWLAAGKVQTIEILCDDLRRESANAKPPVGARPWDRIRYGPPSGSGRWAQTIYFHALNCGFRIAPSAGSGSGEVDNPVGYNRVYVKVDGPLTYEKWMEGLRAGRSFVTNGPLIRPAVEGLPPGEVFRGEKGKTLELEIGLTLSMQDKVEYLEVVQNGLTVHEVRLSKWAESGGKLPPIQFDQSGWFLVRAITSEPKTFRYAASAPYYVEIDYQRRVSKESAQFFLDWVVDRKASLKLSNERERQSVLAQIESAEAFWRKKVEQANAP